MAEISLSVVIGTFNQREKLQAALLSLFKQTLSPDLYEIVVIDSNSTDGTEDMIKSLPPQHCAIKYITVENKGRPSARNRGIDEAQGKIILLTDADMIADSNLLSEHLKAHQKYKNSAFEGLTINLDKLPYIKEPLKAWNKLKWAYFLSGNLSIKKETIVGIGKFDEEFAGYGWEDIELGYRLSKRKLPLYYLPYAINYHNHDVADEDMVKRKFEMGKSAAVFLKKHKNIEIKYFLGVNPIAMMFYNFLKKRPKLVQFITDRAPISNFYKYLLEEFSYRKGLETAGAI